MFSKMKFESPGHALTMRKPKPVEDLQAFIKLEFKDRDWAGPSTISVSSSTYPKEVVEWCVQWINSCVTYHGRDLIAVFNNFNHEGIYQIVTKLDRTGL